MALKNKPKVGFLAQTIGGNQLGQIFSCRMNLEMHSWHDFQIKRKNRQKRSQNDPRTTPNRYQNHPGTIPNRSQNDPKPTPT